MATLVDLDRRSSLSLRTFVVGSVIPMCRNKVNSVKIQSGLTMLLSPAGPDPRGLLSLANEGLALRAVSWKTSSCLKIHTGIMCLAGDEGDGRVATVDPTLGCLRSEAFLSKLRTAMEVPGISDLDMSVLVGATLSLVCRTPTHESLASGSVLERVVDLARETSKFDHVRVTVIPEEDRAALREKIMNTMLLSSIAEAELEGRDVSELNTSLRGNRKGWLDPDDRERALALIASSVVLHVGTRHMPAEKDGLLMDPTSCDVSCLMDVSRRNAVLSGGRQGAPVIDVPLEMFSLHLGVVMASAIRLLAKQVGENRDTMMEALKGKPPLFEQQPYLVKFRRAPLPPQPAKDRSKEKEKDKDTELARLAAELHAFKVQCDARLQLMEGKQQQAKRSKSC